MDSTRAIIKLTGLSSDALRPSGVILAQADSAIYIAIIVVLVAIAAIGLGLWLRIRKSTEQELDLELQTRKNIENILHKTESQFASLINGLKVGVALINKDMKIQMANQTLCDIYGLDPQKTLGCKCQDILEESSAENCKNCPGLAAMTSGTPSESTLSFTRNDGKRVVAKLFASPIITSENNTDSFMLIVEDITSAQEMQEHLHLSEKRYLTLFNELSEGFIFTEIISENSSPSDLVILDINPAFENIMGIAEAEVVESPLGDIFEPEKRELIVGRLLQTAITDQPQVFEMHLPKKDKYLEFSSFCPVEGYIAILCQDITNRKKAELQLAEAREQEVEFGSHIQQTMLFGKKPKDINGADITIKTIPSRGIDGDFHDFIQYDDQHFDLLLGDVMGKGASAALLGAATKLEFIREAGSVLTAQGQTSLSTPEEIVNKVHKNNCKSLIALNGFVSACYARFNLDINRIDFVDCGHTSILHYDPATQKCNILEGNNMPMGFDCSENYTQRSVNIKPGDLLVFYSDGIIQALDEAGKPYGLERLCHNIEHHVHLGPKMLADDIFESVKTYTNKPSHVDDLTCIIIKIESKTNPDAIQSSSESLQANLLELAKLRSFIRSNCEEKSLPLNEEFISHLELAANEAASNIILQACKDLPDARLDVSLDFYKDMAVVSITHPGALAASSKITSAALDGSDSDGFGLYVLRQCVDKVEYVTLDNGLNCIKLIKFIEIKE